MDPSQPDHSDLDQSTAEFYDEPWVTPPFQPVRAIGSVILIACGFGLYEYLLASFWAVPWMGIHARIPWPAFAILAAAFTISVAGLRLAQGICAKPAMQPYAADPFNVPDGDSDEALRAHAVDVPDDLGSL